MLNQINAAMELPVIFMMTALFSAGLLKRQKEKHHHVLLAIMAVDIAALVVDYIFWVSLGDAEKVSEIKILCLIDFVLSYALLSLFHYFLTTHIAKKTKVAKLVYFIIIPLIIIFAFVYFMLFDTGMFFSINENGEYIYGKLNWVNQLIRLSVMFIDVVITLTYSKKIGVLDTVLLLVYEIVPIICSYVDIYFRMGIVYIAVAILVLVNYISVSLGQDMLVAKQKQHLAEQERKLAVEQNKIMISQIQPHFLYNVISSIMSFCREDSEKAVDALADFSQYLRTNMSSLSLETPVPFEKELEHIKTYVRLEKYRFEDRLNVEYDIKTTNFFVPSLALQPLVENAVKHGIAQKSEGGTIVIKTRADDNGITVTVSDDGVGFDSSAEYDETKHIGIKNVKSRLETMCGGTLTMKSEAGKGTEVTVFLPYDFQDD